MRIACIIQERTGSTRLPNKINADIGGRPMWWHVRERAGSIGIPQVAARPENFDCAENDVLSRYWLAAQANSLDAIMRVTGDCPLLDPSACQRALRIFQSQLYDYVANDILPTYPDGMGCEIFTRECLEYTHKHAEKAYDREHVTPFMKRGRTFEKLNVRCPIVGVEHLKFSVDTQDDLDRVRAIDHAQPRDFSLAATLEAYAKAQADA